MSWRVLAAVPVCTLLLCGCALFSPSEIGAAPPKRVSLRFHFARGDTQEGYRRYVDDDGPPLYVGPEALVTERDIRRASIYESPQRRLILLEFKPLAAAELDEATADPAHRRLAIFIDDELVMSPTLTGPLLQGRVLLDGNFSAARAAEIVRSLNTPRGPREPPP